MRSSHSAERPILRLLLLALMGLALASRLALGATLPIVSTGDGAQATDPLAKLQAAMIVCHSGSSHAPSLPTPQRPLLSDLLLFGVADSAHALTAGPITPPPVARRWSAADFVAIHAASQPPLRRAVQRARGPPPIV